MVVVVVVVCECVTPFWFGVHSEACTALSSIACRRAAAAAAAATIAALSRRP